MLTSPRLKDGPIERAADPLATEAELDRMLELALHRGAHAVAIGHGRSAAAVAAADVFARRWEAGGRIVLGVVTWPEYAASWLRQATRFAAADPDLWVMTGPVRGWAQMTRRLLWSTSWRPERTIGFAALGTEHAIGLVGAANLPGLAGATADGGTWTVRDGHLLCAVQLPALRAVTWTYQGTTPASSKNPPVGPSSGSVASRIAIAAPCSGVRTPRKPLRSVAQNPGQR